MTSWPLAGANAVSRELYRLLGVEKGVTAVIGSGGKTTLIARLCRELPGTVIVCTSTHIFPPPELPLVTGAMEALPAAKLCAGTWAENGKLTAPVQDFEELAQLADYVLVEADGSRRLPLKAHLPHEPVIPACANRTIQVLGLSGIGRPIAQAAHRPERYAALCGASVHDLATPERAARVLNAEALADLYLLNQADDPEKWEQGRELAARLNRPAVALCLQADEREIENSFL